MKSAGSFRLTLLIMRVRLHWILLLILSTAGASFLFAYFQTRAQRRALGHELQARAEDLGGYVQDRVEPLLSPPHPRALAQMLSRLGNREGLLGIAVYDDQGNRLAASSWLAARLARLPSAVVEATAENGGRGQLTSLGAHAVYIFALPVHHGASVVGALAVVYDAGFIRAEISRAWRTAFWSVLVEILLVLLLVWLIYRTRFVRPLKRTAHWMRELRRRPLTAPPPLPADEHLRPLAEEAARLAQTLHAARAAASLEARLRASGLSLWTAERLRVHVQMCLEGSRLFVVSNREPYTHSFASREIQVSVPASGLVTALEPILRACDGTWIAHGSGDADAEAADAHARLRVPPDDPHYTLRRVWLSAQENEGYYFGFANEGLWPLCHIAHARPLFRAADWEQYQAVNRKFASAALEEMQGAEAPCVLLQDYHFALLPRLIKAERPDARVAIFWHIPWPNPQAFGICPWQRELLDGLLGADLIGFHIRSHCNYFLETVDATLESRIDWDRSAVNRGGQRTLVRPYPISVEFPEPRDEGAAPEGFGAGDRAALFRQLGVNPIFLALGVDRVDYTKGILERLAAIERFLEKYPFYLQQFTFVQIGSPSRTRIGRYRDLIDEVRAEAERINRRFQTSDWRPIVMLLRQHSRAEIEPFYRAADVCLVTALHDGMNLVAKEYIAARADEQGVLILSRFTGAARELPDALIVNPYDTESLSDALRQALEMDPEQRRARMQNLRRVVRERNVYRWAGSLISDLAELRTAAIEGEPAPAAVATSDTA